MHPSKTSFKSLSFQTSSWTLLLCNWGPLRLRLCQTPHHHHSRQLVTNYKPPTKLSILCMLEMREGSCLYPTLLLFL